MLRRRCGALLRHRLRELAGTEKAHRTAARCFGTRNAGEIAIPGSVDDEEETIIAWQTFGDPEKASTPVRHIRADPHTTVLQSAAASSEDTKSIRERANEFTMHFLPVGYPGSVHPSYLRYAGWQFVATTASSAGGVLSMQALLFAIGLGAGSIPTAAALNWVIKDGLGQLGGVAFASVISNKFDADAKRWRMVSALSLDFATLIELMSPLVPALFLPIASFANVSKNVSWLSASASRAAIHRSFIQQENLGDLTAKAGAQSTLASMMGTAIGVVLSGAFAIGADTTLALAAFSCCSVLHLACNYASLRAVVLPTLNDQRFEILVDDYVGKAGAALAAEQHGYEQRDASQSSSSAAAGTAAAGTAVGAGPGAAVADGGSAAAPALLTPEEVSTAEQFVTTVAAGYRTRYRRCPLRVGACVSDLAPDARGLGRLRRLYAGEEYLLALVPTAALTDTGTSTGMGIGLGMGLGGGGKYTAVLVFTEAAESTDVLRGCFNAALLQRRVHERGIGGNNAGGEGGGGVRAPAGAGAGSGLDMGAGGLQEVQEQLDQAVHDAYAACEATHATFRAHAPEPGSSPGSEDGDAASTLRGRFLSDLEREWNTEHHFLEGNDIARVRFAQKPPTAATPGL